MNRLSAYNPKTSCDCEENDSRELSPVGSLSSSFGSSPTSSIGFSILNDSPRYRSPSLSNRKFSFCSGKLDPINYRSTEILFPFIHGCEFREKSNASYWVPSVSIQSGKEYTEESLSFSCESEGSGSKNIKVFKHSGYISLYINNPLPKDTQKLLEFLTLCDVKNIKKNGANGIYFTDSESVLQVLEILCQYQKMPEVVEDVCYELNLSRV